MGTSDRRVQSGKPFAHIRWSWLSDWWNASWWENYSMRMNSGPIHPLRNDGQLTNVNYLHHYFRRREEHRYCQMVWGWTLLWFFFWTQPSFIFSMMAMRWWLFFLPILSLTTIRECARGRGRGQRSCFCKAQYFRRRKVRSHVFSFAANRRVISKML